MATPQSTEQARANISKVPNDNTTVMEDYRYWSDDIYAIFENLTKDIMEQGEVIEGLGDWKHSLPLILDKISDYTSNLEVDNNTTKDPSQIWERDILLAYKPIAAHLEATGKDLERRDWQYKLGVLLREPLVLDKLQRRVFGEDLFPIIQMIARYVWEEARLTDEDSKRWDETLASAFEDIYRHLDEVGLGREGKCLEGRLLSVMEIFGYIVDGVKLKDTTSTNRYLHTLVAKTVLQVAHETIPEDLKDFEEHPVDGLQANDCNPLEKPSTKE